MGPGNTVFPLPTSGFQVSMVRFPRMGLEDARHRDHHPRQTAVGARASLSLIKRTILPVEASAVVRWHRAWFEPRARSFSTSCVRVYHILLLFLFSCALSPSDSLHQGLHMLPKGLTSVAWLDNCFTHPSSFSTVS